jgi:hypothetical protein
VNLSKARVNFANRMMRMYSTGKNFVFRGINKVRKILLCC